MDLRFIRPEDRRRSGGPGFGTDGADTEPACFRSEAFAEDLQFDEPGPAPARRTLALLPLRLLRDRHVRAPVPGRVLVAAFGMGLGTGD